MGNFCVYQFQIVLNQSDYSEDLFFKEETCLVNIFTRLIIFKYANYKYYFHHFS